jgi:hypothetical protein
LSSLLSSLDCPLLIVLSWQSRENKRRHN